GAPFMTERELFLAALEFDDPLARKAHLQSACGDDADLLRRVESLLALHEDDSQFLATPVTEQLAPHGGEANIATLFLGDGPTRGGSETCPPEAVEAVEVPSGEFQPASVLKFLTPSEKPGSLGRVAHYEVLEVLGRGTFGTVVKAFDEKLRRNVAIKFLS